MSPAAHNVIQHTPGQLLRAVAAQDGSLIEIAASPTGLTRRTNGGEAAQFFTGEPGEAAAVLDALAASYGGAPAQPARTAAPAPAGAARGALGASVLAMALALGLVVTGVVEIPGRHPQAWQSASVTPPPVPDVIPGTPAPASPPLAQAPSAPWPSKPAVARAAPPAVAPPVVALPGQSRQAAATQKAATPAPATDAERSSTVDTSNAAKADGSNSVVDNLQARTLEAQVKSTAANAEAKRQVEARGPAAASDELDRMKAALAMLERGDKLTPEVVAQLPNDIAQRLKDAGAIATEEEMALATKAAGGPDFKIVRLPPAVIDRYRDKDGVASIPETNSWASTGGYVRLPLPGGGEVKTSKDMATLFKLQM